MSNMSLERKMQWMQVIAKYGAKTTRDNFDIVQGLVYEFDQESRGLIPESELRDLSKLLDEDFPENVDKDRPDTGNLPQTSY